MRNHIYRLLTLLFIFILFTTACSKGSAPQRTENQYIFIEKINGFTTYKLNISKPEGWWFYAIQPLGPYLIYSIREDSAPGSYKKLYLYDFEDNKSTLIYEGNIDYVYAKKLTDGNYLFISLYKYLKFNQNFELLEETETSDLIGDISFDGKKIAYIKPGSLTITSLSKDEYEKKYDNLDGAIRSCAFSPDNNLMFAVYGTYNSINILDIEKETLQSFNTSPVYERVFSYWSSDFKTVFAVSHGKNTLLNTIDIKSGATSEITLEGTYEFVGIFNNRKALYNVPQNRFVLVDNKGTQLTDITSFYYSLIYRAQVSEYHNAIFFIGRDKNKDNTTTNNIYMINKGK